MKDNKFFELFNDIDSKFIEEAGSSRTADEGKNAEPTAPQIAHKRKIYPTVLKTAACLAVVGAAAGALIAVGGGAPETVLAPNSVNGGTASEISNIFDTSEVPPDISDIKDTAPAASDISEVTLDTLDISDGSEPFLSDSVVFPPFESAEESDVSGETDEESTEMALAVEEWNARSFAEPFDNSVFGAEYSPLINWEGTGGQNYLFTSENAKDEVRAVSDGEVIYIERTNGTEEYVTTGDHVVIKHNDCIYTEYTSIEAIEGLKEGDKITVGQVIGCIGDRVVYYAVSDLNGITGLITDKNLISDTDDYTSLFGFILYIRTEHLFEEKVNDLYDNSSLSDMLSPVSGEISLTETDTILDVLRNVSQSEVRFDGAGYRYFDFKNGGSSFITEERVSVFLPAENGSKAYALCHGTVTEAEFNNGLGFCVSVECEDGSVVKYAHLDEMTVAAGDKIVKDQEIGTAGTTGAVESRGVSYILVKNGQPYIQFRF